MTIYLDDDLVARHLIALLRKAGFRIVLPREVGTAGKKDVEHLTYAIENGLIVLTHNSDDYEKLSRLVIVSGGTHPGILVVKADNNSKHTMKYHEIVRAILNMEKSGSSIVDQVITLNHWR